jgi:hypothetical protein
MGMRGKIDVFPEVEQEGLPVVVTAQESEVGAVGDAGVVAFLRVDGIAAAIKKKV